MKTTILYLLLLVAFACSTNKTSENLVLSDSTNTDDSTNEISIDTVIDYSENEIPENFKMSDDLDRYTKTERILNRSLIDVLREAYLPPSDSNYIITAIQVYSENYVTDKSDCSPRTILHVTTETPGPEEQHDFFFLQEKDKNVQVDNSKIFYISNIQFTSRISIEDEYSFAQDCNTFAVSVASEGGDIDLTRDKSITFFLANDLGFESVLELVLEKTVENYQANDDEKQTSTSEVRTFEILPTTEKKLADINVHYQIKKDGEVYDEGDEFYVFNGKEYIMRQPAKD